MRPRYYVWLLAFSFLNVAKAATEPMWVDHVINGSFAGRPEIGVAAHHFWQGARPEQCVARDDSRLSLKAGQRVRQRLACPPGVAGSAVLEARVQGSAGLSLVDALGVRHAIDVPEGRGWRSVRASVPELKPPLRLVLSAAGGPAEFTDVHFRVP